MIGNLDNPLDLYTYFGSNNINWGSDDKGFTLNRIDLSYSSYASQGKSEEFLKGIIYGDYTAAGGLLNFEKKTFNVDIASNIENAGGIYGYIVNNRKKIKEYIGTYYQEDIDLKIGKINNEPPESDKDKKRIITYVLE